MFDLRAAANVNDPKSFSNRMRSNRFAKFEKLLAQIPKPVSILDVGGTIEFWVNRGYADDNNVQVTVGNLMAAPSPYSNMRTVKLDACSMPEFDDQSFDIVFSNSVIEHVFTHENQLRMAREVNRIGRNYWVQTPNYWFPVEPHFHFVGWQWLPENTLVNMLRRRRRGWIPQMPDEVQARRQVQEIRLMTEREVRQAFPEARLFCEKYYGLTKSFVAYKGFNGVTV